MAMSSTVPAPAAKARKGWLTWLMVGLPLLLLIVAFLVVPAVYRNGRAAMFVILLILLCLVFMGVGMSIVRRPEGAFIDSRNRISLSKLQAAAWTVVVLAAFAAAAAYNIARGNVDAAVVHALNIQIPGELLLAMGISATSLVGAPAILSLKAAEQAPPNAEQDAANRTGVSTNAVGNLFAKLKPADASWSDLVTGEDVGNAGVADLGKIQQLLITLILLGAYAAYVLEAFASTTGPITTLPTLDRSFVWLLGLSHASYLAYKAAPHTAAGPGEAC